MIRIVPRRKKKQAGCMYCYCDSGRSYLDFGVIARLVLDTFCNRWRIDANHIISMALGVYSWLGWL
jgi:hypothetical protein